MENKNKRAFTLVEMLIVVLIIGILAAALIPRLRSVQEKARDTKRKSDISQIASALSIYKIDRNSYTALSWFYNTAWLRTALVNSWAYLSAMLTDTSSSPREGVFALDGTPMTLTGTYGFVVTHRWWISASAFALIARVETRGAANWLYYDSIFETQMWSDDWWFGAETRQQACTSMEKLWDVADSYLNLNGGCWTTPEQYRYTQVR